MNLRSFFTTLGSFAKALLSLLAVVSTIWLIDCVSKLFLSFDFFRGIGLLSYSIQLWWMRITVGLFAAAVIGLIPYTRPFFEKSVAYFTDRAFTIIHSNIPALTILIISTSLLTTLRYLNKRPINDNISITDILTIAGFFITAFALIYSFLIYRLSKQDQKRQEEILTKIDDSVQPHLASLKLVLQGIREFLDPKKHINGKEVEAQNSILYVMTDTFALGQLHHVNPALVKQFGSIRNARKETKAIYNNLLEWVSITSECHFATLLHGEQDDLKHLDLLSYSFIRPIYKTFNLSIHRDKHEHNGGKGDYETTKTAQRFLESHERIRRRFTALREPLPDLTQESPDADAPLKEPQVKFEPLQHSQLYNLPFQMIIIDNPINQEARALIIFKGTDSMHDIDNARAIRIKDRGQVQHFIKIYHSLILDSEKHFAHERYVSSLQKLLSENQIQFDKDPTLPEPPTQPI